MRMSWGRWVVWWWWCRALAVGHFFSEMALEPQCGKVKISLQLYHWWPLMGRGGEPIIASPDDGWYFHTLPWCYDGLPSLDSSPSFTLMVPMMSCIDAIDDGKLLMQPGQSDENGNADAKGWLTQWWQDDAMSCGPYDVGKDEDANCCLMPQMSCQNCCLMLWWSCCCWWPCHTWCCWPSWPDAPWWLMLMLSRTWHWWWCFHLCQLMLP